ncbi:hypothetical protein FCZ44_26940 [Escherichia coli]|nr:hypothetical protein [Escherichia coli]
MKKAWRYGTHKKTAGAAVRYVCQRGGNPDTRFMRCTGSVPCSGLLLQAVFLCVHGDCSIW